MLAVSLSWVQIQSSEQQITRSVSHTEALGDVFPHYDEHGHCSLFESVLNVLNVLTSATNQKLIIVLNKCSCLRNGC